MPFCTKCGKEVSDAASYCGSCGAPFSTAIGEPQSRSTASGTEMPLPPQTIFDVSVVKRGFKYALVAIAVLVVGSYLILAVVMKVLMDNAPP